MLVKEERPLALFVSTAALLLVLALLFAAPVAVTFLRTGLVPRLPTVVLSSGLALLSFLSLACGLILDSVVRGRREAKRSAYLRLPPIATGPAKVVADLSIPHDFRKTY